MANTFTYTKGYLVEKPEMEKPEPWGFNYLQNFEIYEKKLATLRRFKYDYPCEEGKELIKGKDFEVVSYFDGQLAFPIISITPSPKSYSEQDLLDVWNAGVK